MHDVLDAAIAELLAAWRVHQENRRRRAPLPELAASRMRLDDARSAAGLARGRLAPSDEELASAALTAWCESLEATMTVSYLDVRTQPGTDRSVYQCICGQQVEAEPTHLPAAG